MKRNGRFKNGWFTVLAVFLVSSLAAGCVQGVHSAEEREGPVEDALTGEKLVRVRIPINDAARALTLELARDSIDFYEVVFKHSDGRTFRASATINRELSIVLPVGAYETVLLAGTYNSNTLLASAYQDSVSVDTDTTKITYELKALDASVKKAEFERVVGEGEANNSGTISEAVEGDLTYFSLLCGKGDIGTITISNFPPTAIFDPVLVKNNKAMEFWKTLKGKDFMENSNLFSVFADYDAAYDRAQALFDIAESFVEYNEGTNEYSVTDRALYVSAARAAADAYQELSALYEVMAQPVTWGASSSLAYSIGGSDGTSRILRNDLPLFENAAVKSAWQAVYDTFFAFEFSVVPDIDPYAPNSHNLSRLRSKTTVISGDYSAAADIVEDRPPPYDVDDGIGFPSEDNDIQDLVGALTLTYPSAELIKEAIEKLYAAITFTSGVSVGSFGPSLGAGRPDRTLAVTGGYIDFANEQYITYADLIAALSEGKSITPTVKLCLAMPFREGYAAAYFDFAFKPFGSSQANTWHIKGGLNNRVIDDGSGIGGGILIKVVP